MRWSQLRSRVEAEFAPELQGRVAVHFTRHHKISRCGRAWITVDGREVANFCDWSAYYPNPDHRSSKKDALAAYGELRAWDFKTACWDLIHKGVESSLASQDPLRQALSVLHRKVGKRRLALLAAKPQLHPLVRFMVNLRVGVAGASPNKSLERTRER
jgi:hypothetical protein